MRLILLASAATLIGGVGFAQTLLGQSQPGQNVVVVPPAPPVIAAPPNTSQPPMVAQPAPPPGLVQTPFPPSGSANSPPSGSNSGGSGISPMQAASPAAGLVPSANNAPQAGGAAAPAQPAPPDVAPVPANNWVPGKTAVLGVLNKVDGSTSTLTIPVGGQAAAGDLTVGVQACVTRPPGALPDSAVFITLHSNAPQGGGQVYNGWMVRSTPGATDAGDAGEAFRVIACS